MLSGRDKKLSALLCRKCWTANNVNHWTKEWARFYKYKVPLYLLGWRFSVKLQPLVYWAGNAENIIYRVNYTLEMLNHYQEKRCFSRLYIHIVSNMIYMLTFSAILVIIQYTTTINSALVMWHPNLQLHSMCITVYNIPNFFNASTQSFAPCT